ncbi:MAG: hypothetical protein KJ907_04860, partial [Actinobacteria bacterium]|nr:hypothetical protein [Actinomycetota bacterium]
ASGLSKKDITKWVARLPAKDKDTVLTRLLEVDDPHIVAELRQRVLREIRDARESGGRARSSGRRSVIELLSRVEEIALERRKKEAEQRAREKARSERERAAKRKKHLESLVGKEGRLWAGVDQLIATRQPKRYDEAVSLLQDLHDLADMQGRRSEFLLGMNTLYSEHTRKTTLVERFRKAELTG